jgi:perosamine synthetase
MNTKKNKKIYNVASPYFSNKDINWILSKTKYILKGRLSTGPFTEEFERIFAKFIGVKYAVFLNTCTSALEIAVNSLNLRKGDEVIVPCETFIATGMAVTSQGGKVVFGNVNKDTFCLDLQEIKKRVTKKTKAVMLVHFGGYMPFDIVEIKRFCKKKNITIIEDCAHAIGSKLRKMNAGAIGDAGCFSFFSTKTITTAEGGMLTTNNKKMYNLALSLRERGRDWTKKGELYSIGWRSCRVPEFSALMGLSQFKNINKIISHRSKICKIYDTEIKKCPSLLSLPILKNSRLSIWKHISLLNNDKLNRLNIADILKKQHNISINWAYDPPLHLQPVYKKKYLKMRKQYLNTENLMKKHFHLPLHMQITESDAKKIIKIVINEVNKIVKN